MSSSFMSRISLGKYFTTQITIMSKIQPLDYGMYVIQYVSAILSPKSFCKFSKKFD